MRIVSLFDGISCGRVALERAGIKVDEYIAYEIEPSAIKISQANWPDIVQKGDVLTADFKEYEGYDLLMGGSPCQSLSIATMNRTSLDGKSKLFYEFVRAFEEIKPKWFLFENVASMNDESKEVISKLLGCEPILIDSKDFSAQQRPRYYWTNIPVDMNWGTNTKVLRDIMEDEVDEKYYYKYGVSNIDMSKQVCATLDFTYRSIDMARRVLNPDFKSHTVMCCNGGGTHKKVLVNGRARKLTPLEYERLQTLPDNYTKVKGVSDTGRWNGSGNGWTVDVIAHILKGLPKEGGIDIAKVATLFGGVV